MNIVDLFSGVGGLTFGFYYDLIDNKFVKNTKNNFIFANEVDSFAAKAFGLNFPEINMVCKDIKELSSEYILELIGNQSVDLIIGGPPCQSFSMIGKRIFDDKAKLYEEYLRLLSIIQPKMFVFENVKGILSMKNQNGKSVINDIIEKFGLIHGNIGYDIKFRILNAVDFGVPQNRERVFIVGVRNDLDIDFEFPTSIFDEKLSLKEAISDLPYIDCNVQATRYKRGRPNWYQKLMRGNNIEITHHYVTAHSEKLQVIMAHVQCGQGKNDFNLLIEKGIVDERYRITSGYNNTYGRLCPNIPCTTITNNFTSPSCLRCIHYSQNRTLSLREGARIQSFPDNFRFYGSPSKIKKQIGNAVPPLMAIALAKAIALALGE